MLIALRCDLTVIFSIKSMKFGKYAEPVPFYGNHGSNFGTGSEFGTAEPVLRTGYAIPDEYSLWPLFAAAHPFHGLLPSR